MAKIERRRNGLKCPNDPILVPCEIHKETKMRDIQYRNKNIDTDIPWCVRYYTQSDYKWNAGGEPEVHVDF